MAHRWLLFQKRKAVVPEKASKDPSLILRFEHSALPPEARGARRTYRVDRICDRICENSALPTIIDFALEAFIVTEVSFQQKRDYCMNGSSGA